MYESVTPFKDRITNRILNSGAIGNLSLYSRLTNKFKKPVDGNPFYGSRWAGILTIINKHNNINNSSSAKFIYKKNNKLYLC